MHRGVVQAIEYSAGKKVDFLPKKGRKKLGPNGLANPRGEGCLKGIP